MQGKDKNKLPEFLTVAEIAAMLKINKKTVYGWARLGKITPYVVAGHAIRFDINEIMQIVKRKSR